MKKKSLLLGVVLAVVCMETVSHPVEAESLSTPSISITPKIQWKYGWRDGNSANTIGSARSGNLLPLASSALSSGYSPAELALAYGFNQIVSSGDGRGKAIALVEAYGSTNIQSDLNTFCAQYSLPFTTVSVVYPSGKPVVTNSGWASETTLDVEWAHAMAPGASLLVVVAPDAGLNSLIAAIQYASSHANVVSMSWGSPEFSGENSYDSLFNVPGVSFVAASGDSGAGVQWPASSPFVLGVGGTTMIYNSGTGTVTSEIAWSESGGGVSRYETLASYQAGWNVNAGRGVPDVSYDADPYTGVAVYFTVPGGTGGWGEFGGTSAAAPQWAALIARRDSLGNGGSTLFNTLLYGDAKVSYASLLRDITSGNNGYPATIGYDLVTGLGTPYAAKVSAIPSVLASPTPSPSPTPKATPSPTPTATTTPRPSPTASPSPTVSPTPKPTPTTPPWWWWQYRGRGFFR